jgi:DNA-3-methyladenine glycosylase
MTMSASSSFPCTFFDRDVETVAKALIGTFMFTVDQFGNRTGGEIIETEAYDQNDPAAHCYCPDGRRPLKLGAAEAMLLGGGHAYIYRARASWCLNFVTGKKGFGSAVLIRALMPTNDGVKLMRERHKKNYGSAWTKDDQKYIYSLCKRPGSLCVSLGVDGSLNKKALYKLPFEFRLGDATSQILCGPRVNVKTTIEKNWPNLDTSVRDEATQREWRFAASDAPDYLLKSSYPLRPLGKP